MSEPLKIALTLLSGIIIFVIGQIVVKFIIEPIHEQKKLIGEIAGSILFYYNVGARMEPYYYEQLKKLQESDDPLKEVAIDRYKEILKSHWNRSDEASRVLRQQSSDLLGKSNAIPLYGLWSFLRQVPKIEDVLEASTQLTGMANSTHGETSFDPRVRKIALCLNLKPVAKKFGFARLKDGEKSEGSE